MTYYQQYKILTSMRHLQGHAGSHLWFCCLISPPLPSDVARSNHTARWYFLPRSQNFPSSFSLRGFVQNVSSSRRVYCSEVHMGHIFPSFNSRRDFPLTLLSGRFSSSPVSSLRTLVLLFLHSNFYNRLILICISRFPLLTSKTCICLAHCWILSSTWISV